MLGERIITKYLTLRANVTEQQKKDLLTAWDLVKQTRDYYVRVYTVQNGQIQVQD